MGFFATFWTWLNGQLVNYIGTNTAIVAAALEPTIVTLGTVYVMVWGYLQLTGRVEEPLVAGLKRLVTLAVVLGCAIHLWLYNSVIVDTFYRAPVQLAAAVVGATDPVTTVDTIWSQGGAVADQLWHSGGLFQDIGYKLAGAAVWVLVGLLCVYTMFLIALSSIALAVLLALGPLFLTLLLFDATRRYFEAWLAQLANYALITILTVLVAALLLHIVQSYADQTAALGTAVKTVDALNMVLIAALVFLFMRQVMPVAAALGGGVALNTGGAVSRMVGWGVGSGAGLIRRGRELGLATLKVTSGASAAAEESAAGSASGRAAATRSQQAAWRES